MISLPERGPLTAPAGAFQASSSPTTWFMHCRSAMGPFRTSTGRHSTPCCRLFNPKPGDIQADASSMLHHCNVDRLVAMWQVIHYEEDMFTNKGTSTGQYGTIESSIVTADSPLKPFFDENMNFLTSKSVRNITTFGYTYPEMPNWKMSPEARASYGRAQINSLYGEKDDDLRSARALKGAEYPVSRGYYTAEITVDRSEIPLPAIICLVAAQSVIGRMSLLAVPRTGVASASLPLREVLVGNHSMRDLPPEKVVLFLQEEMTTEIRGVSLSYTTPPPFPKKDA